MNIVDIVIIFILITALMRGTEIGVVRQICSTAGLLAGLFLGIFAQGKIIHLAQSPTSKALLTITVVSIITSIFLMTGGRIGDFIRGRIERAKKVKIIDVFDRILGASVAGATILAAVWLGASVFKNVPLQDLQRQLQSSVVIAQLNKSLPQAPSIVTSLGHLIDPNSFPDVFMGLEPRINTQVPLPSIGELDNAVQHARLSVTKIEGLGCGGVSQGSGFVADSNMVVTNAHVVAGVKQVYVVDGNGRHTATVIWFNPSLDIAVLRADNLAGQPLAMTTSVTPDNTPGAVLGYPGGNDFTVRPATILESFKAIGHDIYNQGRSEREVYSVKAAIEPGNSGGPLVNKDGHVVGVIFAESTTYEDIGYSLTSVGVAEDIGQAKGRTQAVDTGSCTQ